MVREGCSVERVLFEQGRAVGVEHRAPDGALREERARFVVDASGGSSLVARGAGLRRVVRGLKNVAVWSYWKGAGRMPGDARAHILTASIPEGWIWVIPLAETTSVGIVTSRATKAERESLGLGDWYDRTLRACEPVWRLLDGAERVTETRSAADWSYRSRRLSGPGIFLVGDAAAFIDPILSTGVHLAFSAALWAATCIHSALLRPKQEELFRRFYDTTYATTYRELLTQVKAFYRTELRRDSIFWTSSRVLRVREGVRPDLAFLFISAGLLRNAARGEPHDVYAQVREALGDRAGAPAPPRLPGLGEGRQPRRSLSRPLVWRAGPAGASQLVSLRADGLTLSVVRHTPRSLLDRPRGTYFLLELADADHTPLALAMVEERRVDSPPPARPGSRLHVEVTPYPIRPHDPSLLAELSRAVARVADEVDDRGKPLAVRGMTREVRRLLRRAPELAGRALVTSVGELRAAGAYDGPLTIVLDPRPGLRHLPRIYLVAEPRLPTFETEMPILRTRHLDFWLKPERTRDGAIVGNLPEVRRFLDETGLAVWQALRGCHHRALAFGRVEECLSAHPPSDFVIVAQGQLGAIADEAAEAQAAPAPE
jgi:hypothetical protein